MTILGFDIYEVAERGLESCDLDEGKIVFVGYPAW